MKMSNIILLSLISLGLVTSFSFIYSVKKEFVIDEKVIIEGSENLKEKEIEIEDFHSIRAFDQFTVVLTKGEKKVSISAEDNLIDLIKVENRGGVLEIFKDFSENSEIRSNLPLIVKISNPEYRLIQGKQQSDIMIEGTLEQEKIKMMLEDQARVEGHISCKNFEIDLAQQSNANISGNSNKAKIQLSQHSGFKGNKLNLQEADLNMSQDAEASLNVEKEIRGSLSQNSDLNLTGGANKERLNVSSGSKVR